MADPGPRFCSRPSLSHRPPTPPGGSGSLLSWSTCWKVGAFQLDPAQASLVGPGDPPMRLATFSSTSFNHPRGRRFVAHISRQMCFPPVSPSLVGASVSAGVVGAAGRTQRVTARATARHGPFARRCGNTASETSTLSYCRALHGYVISLVTQVRAEGLTMEICRPLRPKPGASSETTTSTPLEKTYARPLPTLSTPISMVFSIFSFTSG